jgi:tetratricopeptide (TPR) repeat protein
MRELARENSLRDIEHAALNAMGTTLFWAHRMGEMSECIDQLKRRFDRSDNQRLRLETMVITALQHQCYGELAEAKPLYDEVIRVARSIDHRPALLGALTWRSFVHFFQSEYNDAEALLIEASELAKELHDGFRLLNCLFCLGMVQGNLGRMSDALRTFNKAINMAQRNGDHAVRAKLPNCLGWIHRELQDFDQARIYDQSGVAIAREDRITEAEAHSLLNLGNNYTVDPDQETPLAAFREAEAVFGNDDWLRWRFNIRHLAGQAGYWLSRSDLERAKTNAECLLETATRHGVRKYIAVAYKLLGEVAFASGNFLKAEELFDLALNELSRHPAPLVAWKIYGALARLHAANGEYAKANETFSLGAEVIQYIASNIDDAALKSTFLNSPAVSAFFKEKRLT